jgi:ABC-type antimicrobial peptide transport system permease subunit
MALGARRGQVIRMVMTQTVAVVCIGMGIGLVAAIGAGDLLRNLVYEVSVVDPITYAAVSLLLLVVAVTACLVPALRAARIDPIHSLRR